MKLETTEGINNRFRGALTLYGDEKNQLHYDETHREFYINDINLGKSEFDNDIHYFINRTLILIRSEQTITLLKLKYNLS